MGTKNNPGLYDCYANAEPDEPMFILLGRDPHAHIAVRRWASDRALMIAAGTKPAGDMRMVTEALECANTMEIYSVERRKRLDATKKL